MPACTRVLLNAAMVMLAVSAASYAAEPVPRTDLYGDPLPKHALARLGSLRFLPKPDGINGMAYSPNGKLLATMASSAFGGLHHGIQIWDVATGKDVGPQALRSRDSNGIAWSADSTRIATCSGNSSKKKTVDIWNVTTGDQIRKLVESDTNFSCIAWSADGSRIVAGQAKGVVFVWDAATGKKLPKLKMPAVCLDISSDGKLLAAGNKKGLTIWNLAENKLMHRLPGDFNITSSVAFSPDEQVVVAGSWGEGNADQIWKWDVVTGRNLGSFDDKSKYPRIAISPDGRQLAATGFANPVRILNLQTRKTVAEFANLNGFAVAFSPDSKTLAIPRRRIDFVDVVARREKQDLDAHSNSVFSATVIPDGKTVISCGGDRTVRFWDIEAGRQTRTLTRKKNLTSALALSHDGRTLAIGGFDDNTISLRDANTGRRIGKLVGHTDSIIALSISPTEPLLVSTSMDGTTRLWDITKRTETKRFKVSNPMISILEFSRDGAFLVQTFPLHGRIEVYDIQKHKPIRTIVVSENHALIYLPAAFSPDNHTLATLRIREEEERVDKRLRKVTKHNIRLLDVRSGKTSREILTTRDYIAALTFSPDGKMIACTTTTSLLSKEFIRVLSAKTGKELLKVSGHYDRIRTLMFTPDGSKLVSGSQDTTLLVWELKQAKQALAEEERRQKNAP